MRVLEEACERPCELGNVQLGDLSEINNKVCEEERKVFLPFGMCIRQRAQYNNTVQL